MSSFSHERGRKNERPKQRTFISEIIFPAWESFKEERHSKEKEIYSLSFLIYNILVPLFFFSSLFRDFIYT